MTMAFRPLTNYRRRASLPVEIGNLSMATKPGRLDNQTLGKHNRTVPYPAVDNFTQITNNQSLKSKEGVKFIEKFPVGSQAEIIKEQLASSFDSTGSVAPLWEDRYCEFQGTDSTMATEASTVPSTGNHNVADRWVDKKARKQFQLKFQKHRLQMASDHDSVVIPQEYEEEDEQGMGQGHDGTSARGHLKDVCGTKAYDVESSDSELDELSCLPGGSASQWERDRHPQVERLRLMEQPLVERLRNLEQPGQVASTCTHLSRQQRDSRPMSPLLNSQEKCGVVGDESRVRSSSPSAQRHMYLPSGGGHSRGSSTDRATETPGGQ